jgi:hypothetical protein
MKIAAGLESKILKLSGHHRRLKCPKKWKTKIAALNMSQSICKLVYKVQIELSQLPVFSGVLICSLVSGHTTKILFDVLWATNECNIFNQCKEETRADDIFFAHK